jgi:hypothetical protein
MRGLSDRASGCTGKQVETGNDQSFLGPGFFYLPRRPASPVFLSGISDAARQRMMDLPLRHGLI